MQEKKVLDMSDDMLDDPESDYEEHESLDFDNRVYREEGQIFESIQNDIALDEVVRDLPEFQYDIDFEEFNDAKGG